MADGGESIDAATILVAPGQVLSTTNLLVAEYRIGVPAGATVAVEFGLDASYGLITGTKAVTTGDVSLYVAGMRPGTEYHLRAVVTLADGTVVRDVDHTFTTGALSRGFAPPLTATTTQGMTPQPGIEMIDVLPNLDGTGSPTQAQAVASDLAGNVIWYYSPGGTINNALQPIKPLPNGNFLVLVGPSSYPPFDPASSPATLDTLREIDLVGNTVREITIGQLNARLPAAALAGCTECGFTADAFHHDVAVLPNGHLVALATTHALCSDLPGCTGTGATSIVGDVVVDIDGSLQPVWAWNTFSHLDVNRRPFRFPDWTHSNAVTYSPSDGDLLISIRHQSWIVKVAYENGAGNGDILWRLGNEGDFTLVNGTTPTDWFNGQHEPSFVSASTSGTFSMTLLDNGVYRPFPPGQPCGPSTTPCKYTTVPILAIDESAKTATIGFHYTSPSYAPWGGNAEVLANGNVEFDLAQPSDTLAPHSDAYEVTEDATPKTAWHLHVEGRNAYRAHRMPSLYPGVAW